MANPLPSSIKKLINQFTKLPGIGEKTAQRLVFYLIKQPKEELEIFSKTLASLKDKVVYCSVCQNLAETNPCPLCKDPLRDRSCICVVGEPLDVVALENTGEYKGLYHVLGGSISPIDGIGPEQLKIKELIQRLKDKKEEIKEVILANNPSLEGEATAMYLAKLIKPLTCPSAGLGQVKITRIARGLPVGGDLEYADEITLSNALKGRKEY